MTFIFVIKYWTIIRIKYLQQETWKQAKRLKKEEEKNSYQIMKEEVVELGRVWALMTKEENKEQR